ncbi:c-type cytochrome [Nitrospira sp. Kam-Ns4a]
MRLRRLLAGGAAVGLALGWAGTLVSQAGTPRVVSHLENGQRIFMSGTTAQGRIVENSHGMEGVGCAMCHGADGRGGEMHGIPVPDITYSFLTDPRGYEHATGRKRPAYNDETLKAAIVAGIDAGGNRLHSEMPRWTGLTGKDLEDLIGYLKTLGTVRPAPPLGGSGTL